MFSSVSHLMFSSVSLSSVSLSRMFLILSLPHHHHLCRITSSPRRRVSLVSRDHLEAYALFFLFSPPRIISPLGDTLSEANLLAPLSLLSLPLSLGLVPSAPDPIYPVELCTSRPSP
jgi:hypothetical protein